MDTSRTNISSPHHNNAVMQTWSTTKNSGLLSTGIDNFPPTNLTGENDIHNNNNDILIVTKMNLETPSLSSLATENDSRPPSPVYTFQANPWLEKFSEKFQRRFWINTEIDVSTWLDPSNMGHELQLEFLERVWK